MANKISTKKVSSRKRTSSQTRLISPSLPSHLRPLARVTRVRSSSLPVVRQSHGIPLFRLVSTTTHLSLGVLVLAALFFAMTIGMAFASLLLPL